MPTIIEGSSAGGITYGTGDFYDSILNDLFLPTMADTVIYPNALLKRLPRDSTRVEGKNVVFPIHTDDSTGVTALGADGLLPAAGTESYERYSFPIKHIYVRMKFDGITMDASRSQMASWLKVVESEAKGKANALARQRQRMYHNDGSGRLCEILSPTGALFTNTTYTARINQGIESPSTCSSAPTKFLKVGQPIAVMTAAGAIKGIASVASIDSTSTFTVANATNDGATNVAAGDWVTTVAALGATTDFTATKDTGYKNEPMGLAGIISDADPATGSFQGIDSDAAANSWHRANILSNSGVLRPLTLRLMDEAWTRSIEIGDAVPTVLWGDFAMVRAYADLLIADRRFIGTQTFDGGYDAVPYNGVPFLADRDMWANRIYMPDETDLRVHIMADPQWMDYDGSIYHRLSDKDAYQATMYCREELGTDTRDRHTALVDLDT